MTTMHLVRATDPVSSVMAAERTPKFAGKHCDQILAALGVCLQICPEQGATSAEIAAEAGLSIEQVCRRLPDLVKAEKVRVLKHDDGADYIRNNFRCWTLV